MPTFQKNKSKQIKGPNATGPKYRTPSFFKGKVINGPKDIRSTTAFKTQHRG